MNTQRSKYKQMTPEGNDYCRRQMLKEPKGFEELARYIPTDGHVKIKLPKYSWHVEPWRAK
ncbi:MAG: hypothetical protein ACXAC5_04035 [Promethearchaeota archaeon]|jgi:hypothetical protein